MVSYRPTLAMDDPRVAEFVSKIGPQIADYLSMDRGCIAPIGTGGRFYGMKLYGFLSQEGKDVTYLELQKGKGVPRNRRQDVRGRKIVIVDDAIATGTTFRESIEPIRQQKDALGIIDVVVAVEYDMLGLANFAANKDGDRNGDKSRDEKRGVFRRLLGTYSFF